MKKRSVSELTSQQQPSAKKSKHLSSKGVLMYRSFYDKETKTWDLSGFTLAKPFEGKKNSISWELVFQDKSHPILSPWCHSPFAPSLIVKKEDDEADAKADNKKTVTKFEGPPPAVGDERWLGLELGFSMEIESTDKDQSFNKIEKEFIDEYYEFLKALKERIIEIVMTDPKTYLRTKWFETFLKTKSEGAPMIERKVVKNGKEDIKEVPKYTVDTFSLKDLTEQELASFGAYVRRVVKDPWKIPSTEHEEKYGAVRTQKFKVNHTKKEVGRGTILCDFWDYEVEDDPRKVEWTSCGAGKFKVQYSVKVWNSASGITIQSLANSVCNKKEGEGRSKAPPEEEDEDQRRASSMKGRAEYNSAELDRFLKSNEAFIDNGFTLDNLTAYLNGDMEHALTLVAECTKEGLLLVQGDTYFRNQTEE